MTHTMHRLQINSGYQAVAKGISIRAMPLNHGHARLTNEPYDSTAFFVRHDITGKEFLFFGDVQPDKLSAAPRTLAVWRAAAPKIPHDLNTIFIECSYPLGRQDQLLYGHLNPEHLADELVALAREVANVQKGLTRQDGSPVKKKPRRHDTVPVRGATDDLRGSLSGVRVFIIHCKEDLSAQFQQPINLVIANQIRTLVDELRLGADIIAAEQGMHIRES